MNPENFKLIVNGQGTLSREGTLRIGSYNALLRSSLPENLRYHKSEEETYEPSHNAFRTAFPQGFAWEVIKAYSRPPVICYKFRHWGYFEGPFKGHALTREVVEFYGIGVMKVCPKERTQSSY
ncbi:hypothetical protein SLEP1_g14592 [Rubroshorea leprosula]|uniref:Uncharacterized protein n=1 Tax=Rubroshorea leprosula TaxID=152421 RepID=A0AAV5IJP3_9ROSI|nr:hypothetical protein SLEP1_g14592 [Rubroshorea leprosula]